MCIYVGPLLLRLGGADGAGGAHWPLQEEVAVRARDEGNSGGRENGGRRINKKNIPWDFLYAQKYKRFDSEIFSLVSSAPLSPGSFFIVGLLFFATSAGSGSARFPKV